MTVFEITAPDGRVLEIEGDKTPSESELNEIFKTVPQNTESNFVNQTALSNVKNATDDSIGLSIAEQFKKLKQDSIKYLQDVPKKEDGMSWIEYAKLRKKYDEDWGLQTPELNPLKFMWKNSILGLVGENAYRGQKEERAAKYTDNETVLDSIPDDAIKDWEDKGKIKAGEAFMRSDWSRAIPFVGSGNSIDETTDILKVIDKKNKGEELSKKEITQLNSYIMDVAEMNYRGISFGGKLIQGALELPSFAGEFMATGGLAAIGKEAMKKTVTKGLQDVTKKEIGKRLTKGLLEGAAGSMTRTIGMPQRVAENFGMRKLHDSLGLTDKGQVVLETADEKPALTFLKAWGDTAIENWSEEMGAGLGEMTGIVFKGANKLLSPLEKKLFSRNTRAAFIKAVRKFRPNATVKDIMTRSGFNGILEEMGEERAGDVLRVIFGIDDRQDVSTFEKLCEAINPGAEELLLELGLFSIPGAMSFTTSQVVNHLSKQGLNDNDISDYVRLTSELEKEKLLSDISEQKDFTELMNFENGVKEIRNHYFTQNLNAGMERTEALAAAEVESNAAAIMSKQYGISLDEAKNRLALNVQSMSDEQAIAQRNSDVKVLQGGISMTENEREQKELEQHNQSKFDRENIENNFGDSVENITSSLKNDVQNVITENNLDETEFNLQDAKIYGSYAKGKNKATSDLDIIVQYSGNMREDDAFNMFADAGLVITDKNGNEIKVDVNPINIDKSGTIEDNLNYFDSLDNFDAENKNVYFQSEEIGQIPEQENNNYKNFVQKVFGKKLTNKEKSRSYIIGKTPEKLIEAGIANNEISVGYKIIEKAFGEKNDDHKLDEATISKIYESLHNPIFIAKAPVNANEKENNRYSIIVDLQNKHGDYILVSIDSNKRIDKNVVNDIRTIHSRESFVPMIEKAFNENRIRKIKKSKLKDLLLTKQSDSISDGVTSLINSIKQKYSKTNILFQTAYKGSRANYEKESTDFIGTGEGSQVHGWGLYYAKGKNIAEGYRKFLASPKRNMTYEGVKIKDTEISKIVPMDDIFNTLVLKGKDEALKLLDERKQKSEKDVKTKKSAFLARAGERFLKEYETYKKIISNVDNSKFDNYNYGQLFKFDIPENDVLLDEDKPFSEQSEKVQKALLELAKKEVNAPYGFERSLPELDARQIYNRLSNAFHGAKNASLKLNEYGIKGITYDGRQDGRCYVIFDDKAVNILKTYYQDLGDNSNSDIKNARGFTYRRYNFDGTVKDNLIVLLKNKADKSTLLHEFAHVYLITLNDLARDNAKAKADLLVVNKWLGFNGVEYTTSQHEKFANGFVAYVRTGKAPTYGLKKAFEQFKRWLNELYNDLVYSENIELDDGAKAVFDEILGGKSQEAVAEKIEDFVKKAENNALLRLRAEHSEKQKLPPNVLSDYQRKYRDTAYNIVWYALSHIKKKEGGFEEPLVKDKRQLYMLLGNDSKINRKNKGVMKQAEKLEHILSECDDVFSGNDGFLSEWGEFFNDPGIGQDEGADTTLALTALDVIKQRKYLYETEKAIEGITDEDIKRAQYELDYILDEFKNNSDRDLVVAGFFDWVDKQPDFLQEDFITKWENTTNEIERYESLSKFEQAKEDLKLYAATLKGFGDYSWQFAEYARKVLKRLDFMTEHDKAKMFDKLKDFNSFREIERNLDDIMDYAETLNDVSLRRNLADTIISEVKHTTPEIKNGTKKTRYDYRTNKLFERLRYLNKLTQEQVQDLYDAYVNGELERRSSQFEENGTIVGKTEDYFQDIENSFLQFKANGMYYNSTELLQTLLAKIQNAKFTGKVARDEMDFETRMNQQNWINSCAKSLETHRGKNGKLEELYSMEANLDSMLSMLFDDNIKNQFSLDDLFAQVDGRVGKDREEILNKISKIFGFEGLFKDAMLNNKFIEMANEKYTIKQRYADKGNKDTTGVWSWEPIELSKMEILYYYIQAKNPVSYSMLTDMGDETHAPKGQFDKFEFDELLKNLSDQEKLMGDALQIAAEKYYNDLNKYHIKKHHIDLGKAMCYFPRKSELKEINELDLFNQYTEKSTNPKFVKMRSAGPSIRIAPANPINVLFNHIQKANTIIIMGDKLDLMNKVFRDNDLGQKIKSVFGENVYKEFMQHITENLYNGQAKTLSNAEGIISKLMSNIIGVPMFIKPQVGLKQIMGLINYGVGDEHVGTIEWMKAFTKVIKNPKSAIDFMMQDEYLKDRLTRGNMNEAMKNQIDNKLTSKLSLLTDYFSLNMRYGDLFNLTLGGKAYIDVLMDKGYTKTQAFELFRKKTISDQQSSISSTLSNLQRNSKNNPFARLLFAYQNTPHQYFRICADAIIKAKQGKISKTQAIKTTFIYWWFLPFIFNMAGSLSPLTLLATGNPDELINDALIACLGSISCIPFFGEMGRALFAGVTGSEYFGNKDWFTRANEAIVKPMNKYRKGNLNFEDILKSLEIFAQGFGIPLEEIDTQLEAIGDYAQGDFAKGFIKTLGYSRYRADAVTGEK